MINRQSLLSDLQKLLQRLEADLLARSESAEVPEVGQRLREEYERAKKAERTAQNYEDWRSDAITQAAAAWVLSCVFVRFLEDNRLIDPPKIAGPGKRLQQARDEWELYLGQAKQPNERDYLLSVFDELAQLPGTKEFFGEHNPIRELPNWLSGDGARDMLAFFQKIDANSVESNKLIHDFSRMDFQVRPSFVADGLGSPSYGPSYGDETRFLGDLYQDLSEAARKKYALLQTPEFVEEFILNRTLEPALDEFGIGFRAKAQRREEDKENQSFSLCAFAPLRETCFRMIDPACGSGHFLLGSFPRILGRWQKMEPGANIRDLVQRTLDSIHGVDINPYAVAIARFRLLLVAIKACGVTRLADAPAFHFNLVCGDSLLHGSAGGDQQLLGFHELAHAYQSEELPKLRRILRPGQYHAVVANPPYITVKDKALNAAYRERYPEVCHMKYSLAVPFLQRLFALAVREDLAPRRKDAKEEREEDLCAFAPLRETSPAGFVGQITSNSFMKREFGKKLVESYLSKIDLTHVIDTSGAYIPGHGTPTVILFGRQRKPVTPTIRAVMGIKGEPATPDDPSQGLVWTAILDQIDRVGSQSAFVSVNDTLREQFSKHPWSIGGGGAAELKTVLDETSGSFLSQHTISIGPPSFTGIDEMFLSPEQPMRRADIASAYIRALCIGEQVRDWSIVEGESAFVPYGNNQELISFETDSCWAHRLWPYRPCSEGMVSFARQTRKECGEIWWSWYRWISERYRTPLSIVFAEVATHNHFVLDRGGKVFKQTAPVIKLPPEATEDDHLALLGLLNSSTACFWLKQACHNKGSAVDDKGARQRTAPFEDFFAFNATRLEQFPLPTDRPLALAQQLDGMAGLLSELAPGALLQTTPAEANRVVLAERRMQWECIRQQMIALQEELDWECYGLYGLIGGDLTPRRKDAKKEAEQSLCASAPLRETPAIELGQRAFEIVLARKLAAGEEESSWFSRHGSTPITEIPTDWPAEYRKVVERRIEMIESNANIALIERPEYKRRWNTEAWESQLERALHTWLLDRLESYFDFDGRMGEGLAQRRKGGKEEGKRPENQETLCAFAPLREICLISISRLADVARQDPDFMQVGELYRNDPAFDVQRLVADLVEAESLPLLPVLRYKATGLRKRVEWEKTWELQREEDRLAQRREGAKGENEETELCAFAPLRDIPVPPKYTSTDFLKTDHWRLRGKLDVPKERWVSFPHCEGTDGTPMIAWAGYDHLQLARAISTYFVDIQERLGGRADPRLIPLLAGLLELLPWLKQWHNEPDAAFDGLRMGDYFEGFISEEARQLGKTVPEIKAWEPPQNAGGRRKRS